MQHPGFHSTPRPTTLFSPLSHSGPSHGDLEVGGGPVHPSTNRNAPARLSTLRCSQYRKFQIILIFIGFCGKHSVPPMQQFFKRFATCWVVEKPGAIKSKQVNSQQNQPSIDTFSCLAFYVWGWVVLPSGIVLHSFTSKQNSLPTPTRKDHFFHECPSYGGVQSLWHSSTRFLAGMNVL